jgi:hypothetical protein
VNTTRRAQIGNEVRDDSAQLSGLFVRQIDIPLQTLGCLIEQVFVYYVAGIF